MGIPIIITRCKLGRGWAGFRLDGHKLKSKGLEYNLDVLWIAERIHKRSHWHVYKLESYTQSIMYRIMYYSACVQLLCHTLLINYKNFSVILKLWKLSGSVSFIIIYWLLLLLVLFVNLSEFCQIWPAWD